MSIRTRWRKTLARTVRNTRGIVGHADKRGGVGLLAIIAGTTLCGGIAAAAPPASVIGSWSLQTDQTYTTLDLTNQGASGAPGSSVCRIILGSIGASPISGIYCPASGRIHFLHKHVQSGVVLRTFTGSVTAASGDAPAHMAGSFNILYIGQGAYGEYPFSGSK